MAVVREDRTIVQKATIFIVDDDPGVSRAMASVAQLLDLSVSSFSSADEFLAGYDPSQPGCLVLDIKMPGMTGLELQRKLVEEAVPLPIIMISGHADVRIAVEAMSHGAVTLLEKPCRLDELTSHIRRALKLDAERRASFTRQAKTESQLAGLSPKEREVFDLVASGKRNKDIAEILHKESIAGRLFEILLKEIAQSETLVGLIRGLVSADRLERFSSADAADLFDDGAATFNRQFVVVNLGSEYETDLRTWLQCLA